MGYDLGGLIAAVNEIAETSFPDLGFLEPSGELDLDAVIPGVELVRVELPGTEYLHLGTITLITDDGPLGIDNAEMEASSTWTGYGQHLAKKYLIEPGFTGTGFHTRKEQAPWLEIKLTAPINLRRIMIRNRPNRTARRARGIRVAVRTAAGRWIHLYDGEERSSAFARATEAIFGTVTDVSTDVDARPEAIAADLVQLLIRLHQRDYFGTALPRDLNRIPISPADRARFRDLVSQLILFPRKLEWTSHGVKRSFRFWSETEKQKYVAYSMELVDDLRDLTANVCLGFGSVLAAVRDHDLIPHDDDLDIVVGFEPNEAPKIADALQLIEKHLGAKGYTVAGKNFAHRLVSRPPNRKVDVFVGIFENDKVAWFPGSRDGVPRDVVFPPAMTDLLGVPCTIPAKPERYLELVYGQGWSVPDRHFTHSGDRRQYSDILR